VVNISFSWDSSYFATCDLSGIVKVWKSINLENVITFETSELSVSQCGGDKQSRLIVFLLNPFNCM